PLTVHMSHELEEDLRPRHLIARATWYLRRTIKGVINGIVLAVSWLVIRAARLMGWIGQKTFSLPVRMFLGGFASIERGYPRLLEWALAHRATVLGFATALFLATLALVPRLGFELVPQLSQGELFVDLRAMPGTAIEQTDRLVRETGQHTS